LEYKYLTLYCTGQNSYDEMFRKLNIAIHQFAKRQMTCSEEWETRGIPVIWIPGEWPFQEKIDFILARMDCRNHRITENNPIKSWDSGGTGRRNGQLTDGFIGCVNQMEQIKICDGNIMLLSMHHFFDPGDQPGPIVAPYQNNRETPNFAGLDQRQSFEQLIKSPESTRKKR
jgi:hypothetical protein